MDIFKDILGSLDSPQGASAVVGLLAALVIKRIKDAAKKRWQTDEYKISGWVWLLSALGVVLALSLSLAIAKIISWTALIMVIIWGYVLQYALEREILDRFKRED